MFALPTALLTALLLAQGPSPAPPAQAPAAPVAKPAVRAGTIPEGRGELTVELDGGGGEKLALQVFTHRPKDWRGERMLLVLHGVLRNADEYRDHAVAMGDRFGALVAAPKFDADRFPSRRYQRGGILRADGSAAPAAEWTYALIPRLVAKLRTAAAAPKAKHWVIGHSAGGQFVLRMSAFQDTGAERLVAANPGALLFPDRTAPFGYGFGGLPDELASDERLRAYLAAPLTLYLGTADDGPDEHFDESKEASKQGGGRHQRSLGCYWTAKTLAAQKGWPFGWRLVEAPGIGHDHEKMFDHPNCAKALFGETAAAPPKGAK